MSNMRLIHCSLWFGCLFVVLLVGCGTRTTELSLEQRADELCQHVPSDYQCHWKQCRDYLTEDFYALLDTMYNLPDLSPVEHQWSWWFIASDGAPVYRCERQVMKVERRDDTHAEATILVFPEDSDYVVDEHVLLMERVRGEWRIADFDGHKADSRRYIDISRREWSKQANK